MGNLGVNTRLIEGFYSYLTTKLLFVLKIWMLELVMVVVRNSVLILVYSFINSFNGLVSWYITDEMLGKSSNFWGCENYELFSFRRMRKRDDLESQLKCLDLLVQV